MIHASKHVHYKRNKLEPTNSNKLVEIIGKILDHLFFSTITEDQPFCFGVKFDSNQKPLIGDGSRLDPFYLFVTSLKLLRFCDSSYQN